MDVFHDIFITVPVNGIMDPPVSKASPIRKTESMNTNQTSTLNVGSAFNNAPSPEFDSNVMVSRF